jgi:hypothetical protein
MRSESDHVRFVTRPTLFPLHRFCCWMAAKSGDIGFVGLRWVLFSSVSNRSILCLKAGGFCFNSELARQFWCSSGSTRMGEHLSPPAQIAREDVIVLERRLAGSSDPERKTAVGDGDVSVPKIRLTVHDALAAPGDSDWPIDKLKGGIILRLPKRIEHS